MTKSKKIGVWIDQNSARLMEYNLGRMDTIILMAKYYQTVSVEDSEGNSANTPEALKAEDPTGYYNALADSLSEYNEALLFGPLQDLNNLKTLLKEKDNLKETKIIVKAAGEMTEYQQYTYVRDYYAEAN